MAVRTPSPAELERRRVAADAKLQATHEKIVDGVNALVGGQEWANYLSFAAKFHDYSFNNTLLIWAQAPQASYVAGYQAWLQLGRQVRKGEKAISVLAPVISRKDQPNEQSGPTAASAPAESNTEQGQRRIVGVRNASVFDVSQTDPVTPGQELPLMHPALLQGDVAPQLWDALALHITDRGFTVERGDCHGANGVTIWEPRIVRVRDDVSTLQAVKTLAHELGHVLMHDPLDTGTAPRDCRGIVEVEAESVAFTVLASQGLDTGDYTFPYLAHWASTAADQDALVAAVRSTGNRVIAASRAIISRLEPAEQVAAAQAADLAARAHQSVQTLTDAAPIGRAAAAEPIFTDQRRELGAVTAATLSYFENYGRLDVARTYLAGRGIASVADGFCVGYAPVGGGLVAHLKQLGFDESMQLAAGVARAGQDGRLMDVFRDRVVAVIADGPTIAGFVGRAVQPDKTPKYLNSPATELFDKGRLLFGLTEGADRLRRGAVPVLVEGPMDALAIAQYHPPHLVPVAVSGTAVTDRHLAALAEVVPSKRIIVALDGDTAGRAASRTVGEKLAAAGWLARIPAVVPGKDPAQLAAENGLDVLTWLHPTNCHPLIYRTVADMVAQYDISEPFYAQQAAVAASVYLVEHYPAGLERDHAINLAHDLCHLDHPAATRYLDAAPTTRFAPPIGAGGTTAGYSDRTYRPPEASSAAAMSR